MSFDPSVFGDDAISEETRGFVAAAVAMREQMPSMENTDLVEMRRLMDEGGGAFPVPPPVERAEERTVPGMGEGATIRIIRPEGREPTGVYLDIHGGGWVIGRARMSDQANLALVEKFGVATVSVDYRLAPEHPYPAGPDDCEAAAVWLVENAAAEFESERLLIGGGSAGAHLAAVTLLRMRDRHGYTGFIGANLVYGVYDLAMTPSQRLGVGPEGGLARDAIEAFYGMFIPGVDATDPDVSPLNANLNHMPPRSSRWARTTRCWTTRCSCTRAGWQRGTSRSWPSIPAARTASTPRRSPLAGRRRRASTPSSGSGWGRASQRARGQRPSPAPRREPR